MPIVHFGKYEKESHDKSRIHLRKKDKQSRFKYVGRKHVWVICVSHSIPSQHHPSSPRESRPGFTQSRRVRYHSMVHSSTHSIIRHALASRCNSNFPNPPPYHSYLTTPASHPPRSLDPILALIATCYRSRWPPGGLTNSRQTHSKMA